MVGEWEGVEGEETDATLNLAPLHQLAERDRAGHGRSLHGARLVAWSGLKTPPFAEPKGWWHGHG